MPLVTTLYQYGRFGVNDVWQTRSALLGYSVGLLALILIKILAPGFYARQQMRTPVKIAFFTVLVSITLAVLLMQRIGHAGLTLATSLGACVNAALLFWFLRRNGYYAPQPGWLRFVSKIVIALGVMSAALYWLAGSPDVWLAATLWQKVARLGGLIAAGAVTYFGTLFALGFRLADFDRRETR